MPNKYHISSDGNVRQCRAKTPDTCRAKGLGGRHFADEESARKAIEAVLSPQAPQKPVKKLTAEAKAMKALKEASAKRHKVEKLRRETARKVTVLEKELQAKLVQGESITQEETNELQRLTTESTLLKTALDEAESEEKKARLAHERVAKPKPSTVRTVYTGGGFGCGGGYRGC